MNTIYKVSPLLTKYELRSYPVTIRVNKFDEDSAKAFCQKMSEAQSTGQSVIPVVIDSYGGEVYSLLTMVDAIKSSRVPVATIVQGKAMSCGAVLLSFGAEGMRFAGPNATIMIHEVTGGSFGRTDDIKVDAKQIEKLNDKILSMISTNIGRSSGYIKEVIHEKNHADWFLDADEAKVINLVNFVRVPELSLTVDVKYKFE